MENIKGYEGLYSINEEGKIYSHRTGKIMKTFKNNRGYVCVSLTKDRIKKNHLVHRLVAKTFLERVDGKYEVNHIDSDKENNFVGNLEWVTRKENVAHQVASGNLDIASAQAKARESNKRKVGMYDLNGNLLKVFISQKEAAEETNSIASKISLVVNGKRKTHNGYIWKRVYDIV